MSLTIERRQSTVGLTTDEAPPCVLDSGNSKPVKLQGFAPIRLRSSPTERLGEILRKREQEIRDDYDADSCPLPDGFDNAVTAVQSVCSEILTLFGGAASPTFFVLEDGGAQIIYKTPGRCSRVDISFGNSLENFEVGMRLDDGTTYSWELSSREAAVGRLLVLHELLVTSSSLTLRS
jgi:hypothetical protein